MSRIELKKRSNRLEEGSIFETFEKGESEWYKEEEAAILKGGKQDDQH